MTKNSTCRSVDQNQQLQKILHLGALPKPTLLENDPEKLKCDRSCLKKTSCELFIFVGMQLNN